MDLKTKIRDVKDFPKPGIVFKDISPLLADPEARRACIKAMAEHAEGATKVVGIDSRGFIFGSLLAEHLGIGFVMARKEGKLPAATFRESYALEYGEDTLEIHRDGLAEGDKVLLVDDLLATGGTLAATCRLIEQTGASIQACLVVIELAFLNGRSKLGERPLHAVITY